MVLIGSSTGGPRALQTILEKLPYRKDAALCIVQHMPPGFTRSLAGRLNQLSPFTVKEGENDERVEGGMAYIAPGGKHMELSIEDGPLKIRLSQAPPRKGHRPSVDVLLESAIHLDKFNLIFVILTGMGKDGLEGLKKLKAHRPVYTIAQDEATSVVYGMPRAIAEADLADEIVPLEQIASALTIRLNKLGG